MSPPPSAPSSPPAQASARWFSEEVHPHSDALKAFLRGRFPQERDVDDIVQESFFRVWKARVGTPIKSAKAFLFRVASNVALDRVRRRRHLETPVGDLPPSDVIDEATDVAESVTTQEKERLLGEALACLPARAHDIVILCKLQGLSHREAAEKLGISERTVAEHLRRGMKRLGKELRDRGLHSLYRP